ncbi:hypothetical protein C7B61_08555 [filamentous cyanobacterium CCP1]|nr:hypothetical protein C7B61_08555 [filamentous cyanobacterium CCP1]
MPPKPLTTDPLSFTVRTMSLNIWQATWTGMGAMIGAGIFVGLGIAARGGSHLVFAFGLAALITFLSGLNRIQLTTYYLTADPFFTDEILSSTGQLSSKQDLPNANHFDPGFDPDIYGHSHGLLNSWLGFTAAWTLALAQAATAATAVLGVSGYLLSLFALNPILLIPIALLTLLLLAFTLWKRPQMLDWFMRVSTVIGVLTLLFFIASGLLSISTFTTSSLNAALPPEVPTSPTLTQVFRAASLLVVAYAGYGRIARLSGQLHHPQQNLPKAIGLTLLTTLLLYAGVAIVAVEAVGTTVLSDAVEAYVAPLTIAAQQFAIPGGKAIVALGASFTLLGMVSYLLRELSQVLWAMGQQQDLPKSLARLKPFQALPPFAVGLAVGMTAFIALANDVGAFWTFAAFAFLLHSAITNLAAFQLPEADRLYPRWVALGGVALCLFFILWLDSRIWLMGAGLVVVGLVWRGINLWVAEQADE